MSYYMVELEITTPDGRRNMARFSIPLSKARNEQELLAEISQAVADLSEQAASGFAARQTAAGKPQGKDSR